MTEVREGSQSVQPTPALAKTLWELLEHWFPRREASRRWFVEAGAHDGVFHADRGGSPTWLLEVAGWDGLCIEPSRHYERLLLNRRCRSECTVLGPRTGARVLFRQMLGNAAELSGLTAHFQADGHDRTGQAHEDQVRITVALADVLAKHRAPPRPEFLVLDTEGSELALLAAHDFGAYRFGAVMVEYNGVPGRRSDLRKLLAGRSYREHWDDGVNLLFVDKGVGE